MPPKILLREIAPAERYFWRETAVEQISQKVFDQNPDYLKRALPENETCVLGLNEIAAKHRRGYFFHLPSRPAWTTVADEERVPPARTPASAPGPQYPTMLYMDVKWSETMHHGFVQEPQRGRYLRSSALANPPPAYTPLFAIQYAFQRCPIFITPRDSLVLFGTPDAYYLAQTNTLLRILGRDNKDDNKLKSANWLWAAGSLDKGKGADKASRRQKYLDMSGMRLATLEDSYFKIVDTCSGAQLEPTYTAAMIKNLIPRPDYHAAGSAGSPLGAGISAEPSSRWGEIHKKKQKLDDDAEVSG